jgi:signal transduction histidine kinase
MHLDLQADERSRGSAYIQRMSPLDPLLRRARSVDPQAIDAALAVALSAWAVAVPGALDSPARTVVLLAMTFAVAWRRRRPLEVLFVAVVGVVLQPRGLALPEVLAMLIAVYSAALYGAHRVLAPALLLVAATALAVLAGNLQVPKAALPFMLLIPVWLAGSAMRRRELRAEASTERADRLEREREASLRAERARIARELHDVVTHAVSVMVLQTGAARQIMSRDEERSRALLESVEASGRSALDELRRLLGLISDEDDSAPLQPQPGIAEIPSLIDQVRHAGLPVELSVEGCARSLAPGVAIAAYRIVQEALTNVLKHAHGAPTRVVLRYDAAALELEILDHGTPGSTPSGDAKTGRGLAGMRERAAMYGGTLDAHAEPNNGYAVRARIPLEAAGR